MKSEDLTHKSIEQLLKQRKTTRFVMGLLIGALVMSLAINIYHAVNKGFGSLSVVPFALLPLLLVMRTSLKQIQQELARRPGQEP